MTTITSPLLTPRPLASVFDLQSGSLLSLSTGLRLTRAADDPAGLLVSGNIRAALSVIEAETRALERAGARASVADGALGEVSTLLQDAEALAVQAANTGALSDDERQALQDELDSILEQVDRVGATTEFADTPLFDGDAVIATPDAAHQLDELSTGALGGIEIDGETLALADVASGADADLLTDPERAVQIIAAARDDVATRRAELGAFQSNAIAPQLEAGSTAVRELSAALSIITGADHAGEIASLARAGVLARSGAASLVLANAVAGDVLALLTP